MRYDGFHRGPPVLGHRGEIRHPQGARHGPPPAEFDGVFGRGDERAVAKCPKDLGDFGGTIAVMVAAHPGALDAVARGFKLRDEPFRRREAGESGQRFVGGKRPRARDRQPQGDESDGATPTFLQCVGDASCLINRSRFPGDENRVGSGEALGSFPPGPARKEWPRRGTVFGGDDQQGDGRG